MLLCNTRKVGIFYYVTKKYNTIICCCVIKEIVGVYYCNRWSQQIVETNVTQVLLCNKNTSISILAYLYWCKGASC